MKLLELLFGKWIKWPLPMPVYVLYVLIPTIIYMIAAFAGADYYTREQIRILGLIGLGMAFIGMVYMLIRDRKT